MSGNPGRSFNVGGFITLAVVVLLSVGIATADQIPANCNATGLQFTTVREKTLVTLGEVNRYTVSVTNDDNPGAGSLACDVENILVIFCCPDIDGHAPNEAPGFDPNNPGPLCTVLSDGFGDGNPPDRDDFPANFGTRTYATQECTIDGFFVSGSSKRANVKVQAGFDDLQYGFLHDVPGESPLNREDLLGVTVAECAVQVDKAVACDGTNYVDQTLVSNNEDNTNGCYGWNSHDSNGNGVADGAEPLNVQYRASNIGDPGAALFSCQIVESNGNIINVPIDVGDLADGETSNPFTVPSSCDESLDDFEPDTAEVTCFCVDPNSPDFDPGLTTTASDLAEFDCQTPSLTISKNCTDDLTAGDQFPVDITVSNDGDATLINCVVTDTAVPADATCPGDGSGVNVPLTPVGGFDGSLQPGESQQFTGAVDVLALVFANNAQVVCQIADENGNPVLDPGTGQPKTITRDDCDTCETTCEVELDKQISCDGRDLNDPAKVWYDVSGNDDDADNAVIAKCLGWNSFDPGGGDVPAEGIDVRYVASNNGLTGLYSCELTDSNGLITGPINVGDIITGGSDTQDVPVTCSEEIDDLEPNTASISCLCADDPSTTIPPVQDEDSAEFDCQTPDLTINKDCVEPLVNNQFPVDVSITNAGDATLINCEVTDTARPDDPTCPTGGPGVDIPLTAVGGFDGSLLPAASQDFTGVTDVLALGSFANGATVTCEIADENGDPVLDPATGQPKTITRDDCNTCDTTCTVELDKQVSCDGKDANDPTKTWYDVTGGDDNAAHTLIGDCWGWNAFDTGDGLQGAEPIDVRYVISNTGDATLYQCEVTDSNGAITGPINAGDIATLGSDTQDVRNLCDESLDDLEPDTGAVSCLCVDDITTDLVATDDDQASFDCQTPELRITKDCLEPNVDGIDDIDISVFNDGDANLINCQVVDEVYQDSATCGAPGAGDLLNLNPAGPFDPADFDLGAGGSVDIDSAVAVMATSCNRATVMCEIADHNGNPVVDPVTGQNKTISAQDDDLCEPPPCMVEVDKQVSCDGGATWRDMGLQSGNGDGNNIPCVGWNAFTAPDGTDVPAEEILVRYRAHNDSPITVYDCTLTESNAGLPGVGLFGDLAAGEIEDFYFPDGSGAPCTAALANDEPDTATLSCFCSEARDPAFKASATDGANFDCQTPGLEVIKVCGEPDSDLGIVPFDIMVTNTSLDGADLANCTVTDEIFLDDNTCPAGPAGAGTDLPVVPDFIANLPAGSGTVFVSGETTCPTVGAACNTATVTCEIVDSVDPDTGGPKTITGIADDLCEPCGEGCLTHTPGFWGNHPHVTERFLPLTSCGIEINNTFASTPGSAPEDMCWGGRDFKAADTSSSQLQLIRQCLSAKLSIAATIAGAGSCDSAYPNINSTIDSCCDVLCPTGPTKQEINASGCIGLLDAFNNLNDTLDPYGPFIRPGPAQSGECREANGNGYVNPGRNLGPRQ